MTDCPTSSITRHEAKSVQATVGSSRSWRLSLGSWRIRDGKRFAMTRSCHGQGDDGNNGPRFTGAGD